MDLKEALAIVLDLATDNAIDEDQCCRDQSLLNEMLRQEEALAIVAGLHDNLAKR